MVRITPNFNFAGQCEEAIALYIKAFGAKVGSVMRYDDAVWDPSHAGWSDEEKKMIYHAEIFIGEQRIMLADQLELPFSPGLSLSLVVTQDTKEEVLRAFEAICEGGEVIYPPHSTPYSSCTTNVIDRFGFRWCVMTERTAR